MKPDMNYNNAHMAVAIAIMVLAGFGVWKVFELLGGLL